MPRHICCVTPAAAHLLRHTCWATTAGPHLLGDTCWAPQPTRVSPATPESKPDAEDSSRKDGNAEDAPQAQTEQTRELEMEAKAEPPKSRIAQCKAKSGVTKRILKLKREYVTRPVG